MFINFDIDISNSKTSFKDDILWKHIIRLLRGNMSASFLRQKVTIFDSLLKEEFEKNSHNNGENGYITEEFIKKQININNANTEIVNQLKKTLSLIRENKIKTRIRDLFMNHRCVESCEGLIRNLYTQFLKEVKDPESFKSVYENKDPNQVSSLTECFKILELNNRGHCPSKNIEKIAFIHCVIEISKFVNNNRIRNGGGALSDLHKKIGTSLLGLHKQNNLSKDKALMLSLKLYDIDNIPLKSDESNILSTIFKSAVNNWTIMSTLGNPNNNILKGDIELIRELTSKLNDKNSPPPSPNFFGIPMKQDTKKYETLKQKLQELLNKHIIKFELLNQNGILPHLEIIKLLNEHNNNKIVFYYLQNIYIYNFESEQCEQIYQIEQQPSTIIIENEILCDNYNIRIGDNLLTTSTEEYENHCKKKKTISNIIPNKITEEFKKIFETSGGKTTRIVSKSKFKCTSRKVTLKIYGKTKERSIWIDKKGKEYVKVKKEGQYVYKKV